jgi:hypothetical protein
MDVSSMQQGVWASDTIWCVKGTTEGVEQSMRETVGQARDKARDSLTGRAQSRGSIIERRPRVESLAMVRRQEPRYTRIAHGL